jgi:hypothetical protein
MLRSLDDGVSRSSPIERAVNPIFSDSPKGADLSLLDSFRGLLF